MSPLGFKARLGRVICTWQRCTWHLFPEIHFWCDTCWPLDSPMSAEPFSSTYLWPNCWAQNWDLSCLCLTVWDQADALVTELCQFGSYVTLKSTSLLSQQTLWQKVSLVSYSLPRIYFFVSWLLGESLEALVLTCEGNQQHTLCDLSFCRPWRPLLTILYFLHGFFRWWWTPLEFPLNFLMSCTIGSWKRKQTGLSSVHPFFHWDRICH